MRLPRLRVSTVVFLVLVAAVILLANIPGQIVLEPDMGFFSSKYGPGFSLDSRCHHGWPFTFLVREPVQTSMPLSWELSPWKIPEGVVEGSWWCLAGDVLVGLSVLFVAGAAFERWRRRRGRFQLRLIDMFAIVTLVACGFAYWATLTRERNRQANVVKQLVASGMMLNDDAEWSRGGPSWLRDWLGDRPFAASDRVIDIHVTGEGLSHLSQLPNLKVVRLEMGSLSNEQIDALRELPGLEALGMEFASICHEKKDKRGDRIFVGDEDAYVRLPPMPHLRGLNVYEASFRGEGLEYLRDIETLDLTNTDVGDDVMPKFEAMRSLKRLSLAETDVTDAGVEHLNGLAQLRELWLGENTKVTAEGIKRLQRALPNCKIE